MSNTEELIERSERWLQKYPEKVYMGPEHEGIYCALNLLIDLHKRIEQIQKDGLVDSNQLKD